MTKEFWFSTGDPVRQKSFPGAPPHPESEFDISTLEDWVCGIFVVGEGVGCKPPAPMHGFDGNKKFVIEAMVTCWFDRDDASIAKAKAVAIAAALNIAVQDEEWRTRHLSAALAD